MAVAMPDVRFQASYLQHIESVSTSRGGNRVVAIVQWADPFWQIDLRTVPLKAAGRRAVEAFVDAARGGLQTVHYVRCTTPQAHWGAADTAMLANGALVSKSGASAVLSAEEGLVLSPGDMLSLTTGDYNWLARVVSAGAVEDGKVSVTLNRAIPSFITTGAVARFKDPVMNARILPGSFQMADEILPVVSFSLTEVPK